jgi:hypothetical protein
MMWPQFTAVAVVGSRPHMKHRTALHGVRTYKIWVGFQGYNSISVNSFHTLECGSSGQILTRACCVVGEVACGIAESTILQGYDASTALTNACPHRPKFYHSFLHVAYISPLVDFIATSLFTGIFAAH